MIEEDNIINPTFHLIKSRKPLFSDEYMEYRNKWRQYPNNFIVSDFPLHVDIELNTTCNLRCPMCFQTTGKIPQMEMGFKIYSKVIREGGREGVYSVKLNYRGEPLCSTHLLDTILWAKQQKVLDVMLNTNGTLLNIEFAKGFIDCGLDLIVITIDGITQKVYEKIRVGGKLNDVVKNVVALQTLKKLRKAKKPIVRVQFVEQEGNKHQKQAFINYWRDIADEVSVVDLKDTLGVNEDLTPLPDWWCASLWQRLFVLADGDVVPCCRALKDGHEKMFVLGNVKHKSLKRMWHSKKMEILRTNHRSGNSHLVKMCQICGVRKEVIKQNGR